MTYSVRRKRISYILKSIVILSAAVGIFLSASAGKSVFMGGSKIFMFFTIQSNIAVALICMAGAVRMSGTRCPENWWYVIKFVGTVSITLTGMVFSFVLAPAMGRQAWNPQNILTHVVVPAAAVADFFVTGICSSIDRRSVIFVILPPLAYVIYAGIAYNAGWEFLPGICYPYFFLNWGSPAGAFGFTDDLPYMGCVWWILILLIFLIMVALLYLSILDNLKKRHLSRH